MNGNQWNSSGVVLLTSACLLLLSGTLAAQNINPDLRAADSSALISDDATASSGGASPLTDLVYSGLVYSGADSPAAGQGTPKKSDWEKDPNAWRVILYPVFGWMPILGVDVKLPQVTRPPGEGGGSVIPEGTTSGSFNSAAFAGAEIYKGKWSATAQFLYAGLSGDKTVPKVHVGMDFIYGGIMGGREVFHGLSLEGGVRRLAINLTADVGTFPQVKRTPGFWDPLLGATYRKQLSKKWRVQAHLDGGGFGVGSDVDIGADGRADWRFAKHFGLTMGLAALHVENSNTVLRKTLTLDQTMYGPVIGFGIYF